MAEEKIKKQDEKKSEKEKNTAEAKVNGNLTKETDDKPKESVKPEIKSGLQSESNPTELKDAKKSEEKKEELKLEKKEEAEKTNEKKSEVKKKESKPAVKKTEAVIRARNLPISTKHSIAICRFIKGKTIERAEKDLERVLLQKIAVPMKGEIPHRKTAQVGNKKMAGRFPKNATQHFIKLLRSLGANANVNNLEEPVIVEAIANIGERPFGRFGRTRKKRTHVMVKVKEKPEAKKPKEKKQEEKIK